MLVEREKISRTPVHKVLIAVGCFLLFWPAATTNLFGDGLAGYQPSAPPPRASWSDWFDRSFQTAADEWWKERFGLRFFFVKLDNQLDYWLFDRIYEGDVQISFGADGWIYHRNGVQKYCREVNPTPEAVARETIAGVRAVQDEFDARGIPFVFMVSPMKAAVYPEYLPEDHCSEHGAAGYDYELYRPLLDEYGIRYVDGYALIQAAKSEWPQITLFARGGAHWNNLGAYYTAKAILEKIRPLTRKTIPPLELGDVPIDNDPNRHDRDLAELQNLLFPDTDFPVPHPEITMAPPPGGGLWFALIGMSFLEQIGEIYAHSGGFDRVDHYWYYHTGVRDRVTDEWTPLTRETIDWPGGILAADAVVLDMNMADFLGEHINRFVEDAQAYFAEHPRSS